MFWNKDKNQEKPAKKKAAKKTEETVEQNDGKVEVAAPSEYGILKGFYISEKASVAAGNSQYVFRVFKGATKNEVKKQVEKSYGVKVKAVRMTNLPSKKVNIGRYSGVKPGVRKAIVVLEKGQVIEQAQP